MTSTSACTETGADHATEQAEAPPWNAFDPEAYFEHYYGEPHQDDWELTYLAAKALKAVKAAPGRTAVDIIDVGTGPSLIPLLAALPVATHLTAWEYATPNIEWLAHELGSTALRPQWRHFWNAVRAAHDEEGHLPDDPLPLLRRRTSVSQGSIYDLPRHAFDAATMYFCAESITSRHDDFDRALGAFTASVRPGGVVAAAFLAGSTGYHVSGRRFPAVPVDAGIISGLLRDRLDTFEICPIGLSPLEVRSGYCGALFLSGRTRS
jgi:hypothetical protein